jgi:hypothetical protein
MTTPIEDVAQERASQDARWGEQNHPDGTHHSWGREADTAKDAYEQAVAAGVMTWQHVLLEEVMEAFAETDPVTLREELIQVAAVAVAWAESIDRREAAK